MINKFIYNIIMLFLSEEKKEQVYIAQLKHEMLLGGYDISHMTDQQIKDGMNNARTVFSSTGLTLEEACNAFKMTSKL